MYWRRLSNGAVFRVYDVYHLLDNFVVGGVLVLDFDRSLMVQMLLVRVTRR